MNPTRQARPGDCLIGAFARMLGTRERVVSVSETSDHTYAVTAQTPGAPERLSENRDAPPEAFVQKLNEEGGTVYVAPMLEALRELLRRRRASTLPEVSEKH